MPHIVTVPYTGLDNVLRLCRWVIIECMLTLSECPAGYIPRACWYLASASAISSSRYGVMIECICEDASIGLPVEPSETMLPRTPLKSTSQVRSLRLIMIRLLVGRRLVAGQFCGV